MVTLGFNAVSAVSHNPRKISVMNMACALLSNMSWMDVRTFGLFSLLSCFEENPRAEACILGRYVPRGRAGAATLRTDLTSETGTILTILFAQASEQTIGNKQGLCFLFFVAQRGSLYPRKYFVNPDISGGMPIRIPKVDSCLQAEDGRVRMRC